MVLTPRELEVLALIGHGYTNTAIGDRLQIKHMTVSRHIRNLLRKLGIEGARGASELNPRVVLVRMADRLAG